MCTGQEMSLEKSRETKNTIIFFLIIIIAFFVFFLICFFFIFFIFIYLFIYLSKFYLFIFSLLSFFFLKADGIKSLLVSKYKLVYWLIAIIPITFVPVATTLFTSIINI